MHATTDATRAANLAEDLPRGAVPHPVYLPPPAPANAHNVVHEATGKRANCSCGRKFRAKTWKRLDRLVAGHLHGVRRPTADGRPRVVSWPLLP